MPASGEQWLHFQLVEKIGEGGMGVVWQATDTTLDRAVALKLLPDLFANDPERRARLEREARLLAALSHPNIAAIHGLHTDGDRHFLSMELAPGEDLAALLTRGPMDVDEVLGVARQIAAGLAAAHDRGIVHRDLKPANIKLAPDGSVRILDFGLAKAIHSTEDSSLVDPARSPTITLGHTAAGTILGTASYMSPEQARGRPVDRRTDLWAFGCVLYELLTGRHAFHGETVSDTLAAILRAEPDWEAVPVDAPLPLRDLMRRCLSKDPSTRWRDAGDAGVVLAEINFGSLGDDAPPPRAGRRRWLAALTTVLLIGLLAGGFLGGRIWEQPASNRTVVDAQLPVPDGYSPQHVEISPDGRNVAIVLAALDATEAAKGWRLAVRAVDRSGLRWVDVGLGQQSIQFSPDSQEIAFVARSHPGVQEWALVRAPVEDLAAVSLVAPWQDNWSGTIGYTGNGEIAIIAGSNLLLFPTDGRPPSDPVPIQTTRGAGFLINAWLPDGDLLGTIQSWEGGYNQHVARLDPQSGEVTVLIESGFEPMWMEPGKLIFSRGDQLIAQPYDLTQNRVTGGQQTVASGLRASLEATAASFSLSSSGDLLHLTGGRLGLNRQLAWFDRDGSRTVWENMSGPFVGGLDDSQDGRFLSLFLLNNSNLFEVWVTDSDRPTLRPAVALPGMDCTNGTLSPRGRWIAARCTGDITRDGVYVAPLGQEGGQAQRVLEDGDFDFVAPISWLPDGDELLVLGIKGETRTILRLSIGPDGSIAGEPVALDGLDPRVSFVGVSPDGVHVAIVSFHRGGRSISLAPWRDGKIGAPRILAQADEIGADWVRQLPDGRHELLIFKDGRSYRVLVDAEGRTTTLEPIEGLVDAIGRSPSSAFLADGRMIAIELDPAEKAMAKIRLVTGWTSTLE